MPAPAPKPASPGKPALKSKFDINKFLNDFVSKVKKFFIDIPVKLPKFPDYIKTAKPDEMGAWAAVVVGLILIALGVSLMLTRGLFTIMVLPFFLIMLIVYAWIGALAFAESEMATAQNDKKWRTQWMAISGVPLIGVLVYFFVARKELKPMDRSKKPAGPQTKRPRMLRKAPARGPRTLRM